MTGDWFDYLGQDISISQGAGATGLNDSHIRRNKLYSRELTTDL
jgi:hypothetical protein